MRTARIPSLASPNRLAAIAGVIVVSAALAGRPAGPPMERAGAVMVGQIPQPTGWVTARLDAATAASPFVQETGATASWAAGDQGQGVGVAVIDTGVSPVPDLAGRVVYGPNLSGDGTNRDLFGHGTVMAGIIAGNGARSATRPGGRYVGVAPRAKIIAVKVAGRSGKVDAARLVEALSWVDAARLRLNIRVVNLSLAMPVVRGRAALDAAVERLWRDGVVVVASAGNGGPRPGTVGVPGNDPAVITVGAYDPQSLSGGGRSAVPTWSARGSAAERGKPNLVAPGHHVIAIRAPGSVISRQHPTALRGHGYIRGSGTSQATAVTTGLVALLLSARPHLTPDQVKHILLETACPLPHVARLAQGAGRVELQAALTAPAGPRVQQPLEALSAADPSATWTGSAWTGSAWTGSAWTGSAWTGSAWTGSAWTGSAWTGSAWTGFWAAPPAAQLR